MTRGSIKNTLLSFTPDGKGLLVLRTTDRKFHWAESKRVFVLDLAGEADLLLSPARARIAFTKGTELFVMDDDGNNQRRLVATWSAPTFDWSPDGKRIAFVGRRDGEESDIYTVNLTLDQEEETERDLRLIEALEAMETKGKDDDEKKAQGEDDSVQAEADPKDDAEEQTDEEVTSVAIDFEGLHDRLHRISLPDSEESTWRAS